MNHQNGPLPKECADIVVGLQWGDEGKGKIVSRLIQEVGYDMVVRFNGGANAGHTVVASDGTEFDLHQIPSGILHPNTDLYIGSGCKVNFVKLLREAQAVQAKGIHVRDRLFIDPNARIVQPHHVLIDAHTGGKIGTTANGIGPVNVATAMRTDGDDHIDMKAADVYADARKALEDMKARLKKAEAQFGPQEVATRMMDEMEAAIETLRGCIIAHPFYVQQTVREGAKVLFEGAQSFMLDAYKGHSPYVTAAPTEAAMAFSGGGLPPKCVRDTYGVAKVIASRVGYGPFPSEFGGRQSEAYSLEDGGNAHKKDAERAAYENPRSLLKGTDFEIGVGLRMLGGEYGVSTGRPRRIGALDVVQMSHAARICGVDRLALTKVDLLTDYADSRYGATPLTTSYELNGQPIDYVPASTQQYYAVRPVNELVPTHTEDISSVRRYEDLPALARGFVEEIENRTGIPVWAVGTGPGEDELIVRS